MTKFEQVGVNNLMTATNKSMLTRNFSWSCDCCCTKGMHIECDHCAIQCNYELLMAVMEEKERRVNS